ncbi:MAG: 3-deoxy-manno-octulosonate cytidylyltransferase [Planctomycetaceae bacterium]|nr:3-deoxy-manno-octulosonate cytidylyltransferase [Planctomycetaceae bacterium]
MAVVGLIPARLESSRLPRKLLLSETGKPLIQHTWESVRQATGLDEVIVATDSSEIADVVRAFGGRAELTGDHPSGTDRIAEVVRRCCPDAEIVVNVQGDEPEISTTDLDSLIALLRNTPRVEMATLATPIEDSLILSDPSCVKVVRAADGRALYFSRAAIPHCRDGSPQDWLRNQHEASESPWLLHLGVYAYRREFLLAFTKWPPGRLEQLEKLEQLRALEAGASIQVGIVRQASVGIDTRADYARFVARMAEG